MTFAEKKGFVLKYVRLGMDVTAAMICSECTDEEISSLEEDENFQRECKIVLRVEEAQILEQFHRARKNNIARDDTRDTRWILSKIDPERFGDGGNKGKETKRLNLHIDFGSPDSADKDDNVEVMDYEVRMDELEDV